MAAKKQGKRKQPHGGIQEETLRSKTKQRTALLKQKLNEKGQREKPRREHVLRGTRGKRIERDRRYIRKKTFNPPWFVEGTKKPSLMPFGE